MGMAAINILPQNHVLSVCVGGAGEGMLRDWVPESSGWVRKDHICLGGSGVFCCCCFFTSSLQISFPNPGKCSHGAVLTRAVPSHHREASTRIAHLQAFPPTTCCTSRLQNWPFWPPSSLQPPAKLPGRQGSLQMSGLLEMVSLKGKCSWGS